MCDWQENGCGWQKRRGGCRAQLWDVGQRGSGNGVGWGGVEWYRSCWCKWDLGDSGAGVVMDAEREEMHSGTQVAS